MKLTLTIILSLFLLSSCGLFKKEIKDTGKSTLTKNKAFQPDAKMLAFVDSLEAHYLDYETLIMKFSGSYQAGKNSTPLKGIIRMKKDSFIWVSIRPGLGIELARALFTPDSVKLLDRMKSEYFLGDYAFLDSAFGINANYDMLQALLTDQFFVYNPDKNLNPPYAKFKLYTSEKGNTLTDTDSTKVQTQTTSVIVTKNFTVEQIHGFDISAKRSVEVFYKDYVKLNNTDFPKVITAVIKDKDKRSDMELKFSAHQLNKPVKPTFKISSSYKPMTFGK